MKIGGNKLNCALRRNQGSVLLLVAMLAFGAAVALSAEAVTNIADSWSICFPLALLLGLCVILACEGKCNGVPLDRMIAVIALSSLALAVRYIFLQWRTSDYAICLEHWMWHAETTPGFGSLAENIGDYNAPYFYIIFLVGKLAGSLQICYLKMVSIAFDLLMAYYAMRLVSLCTESRLAKDGAFFVVLLLPTVILNSGLWAQCDAIYAAFLLGALYYGILGKSRRTFMFCALAIAFKLQSVFLAPIILVLLLIRRIRLRDIWVFFATFFATLLPSWIAGRGLLDLLSIYGKQTTHYQSAAMNAPTIFPMIGLNTLGPAVKYFSILFAGTVCLLLVCFLYARRKALSPQRIIHGATLFAMVVPFLLPHMHERYFYVADVLATILAFCSHKYWYVPLCAVTISTLCYMPALFGSSFVMPIPLGVLAVVMFATICVTANGLVGMSAKTSGDRLNAPTLPEK